METGTSYRRRQAGNLVCWGIHRSEESSDEDGDEQAVTVASQPIGMDQWHDSIFVWLPAISRQYHHIGGRSHMVVTHSPSLVRLTWYSLPKHLLHLSFITSVFDRLLKTFPFSEKWYIQRTRALAMMRYINSRFTLHYITYLSLYVAYLPSVLWRCWLGSRKGIRPVKNWVVGCWHGCLGWGADLHIAQQIPLPLTISCSSKSRLVLTFLVLPFWYLLARVVPDKFQKSSKTVVWVCVYIS